MNLNDAQSASRTQFDKRSEAYGRQHILAETSDVRRLVHIAPLRGRGLALDVATGGGHAALCLAKLGFAVTVSDVSENMVAAALRLLDEEGFRAEANIHTAEILPYADATFSLVSCRVAAHHFSDPGQFLLEAARVLHPGGFLLLIDGSIPDGEPEAESWIHQVEKLRDPSHGRFLSPASWKELCGHAGLEVIHCELQPFKQPDLNWYFETAATSPENRKAVLELIRNAPASVRRVLKLSEEDGRIVWWWSRLELLARKASA